ncbi:MAG: hypothetical protein Q9165_001540 [Trypethelium subeluteriae]
MTNQIVFILGAGPNIGHHAALSFKNRGYSVALAASSLRDGRNEEGILQIQLDLADTSALVKAFSKVRDAFGSPPSVVIYNGASRTVLDQADPLSSINEADVSRDMTVNAISPLIAAKCAVAGFGELPASSSKTFIHTGNKLNVSPRPPVLVFGMGKSAVAHAVVALTKAYGVRGYRFYFTDERLKDGTEAGLDRDGPAHGALYVKLAESSAQGPPLYTFVKGEGYRDFGEIDRSSA